MKRRPYGQYCGLARAAELLGERWALLIVRDLLVRPRRYTDLHAGLPGIPTNVLSTRLKELEAAGVIERRLSAQPERAVVYALTDDGLTLEDAVLGLARWGAQRLGDPRPGEVVTAESLVMALRSTYRPQAAASLNATWQIRAGEIVIHARTENGALDTSIGPSTAKPDLTITLADTDESPLRALMAGELTAETAVKDGLVQLVGPVSLLRTFAEIFHI